MRRIGDTVEDIIILLLIIIMMLATTTSKLGACGGGRGRFGVLSGLGS
jgi:hypothetical protein